MFSVENKRLGISDEARWAFLRLYAAGLVVACAGLAFAAFATHRHVPLLAVPLLGGVAWLSEKQSVRLGSNLQSSVTVLPILFAAVVFGPIVAMAVGAAAMMVDFGTPYTRWLIWTATRAFAAGLAGTGAMLVRGDSSELSSILMAVAAAAAVEALADIFLNSVTLSLRGTGSFTGTARTLGHLFAGALPLYVPVIAVLAYAYEELSPWTVLLFFVPALAAQRLYVLYQHQRELTTDLVGANDRLERANLSFATALVATLDARDHYTAGHSAAVAIYSRDIAARMGLDQHQQKLAHLAGLVHDIGKIGLPAGLLEKTGPLTLDERRQMEAHSAIGHRILLNVEDYAEIAAIVRHHHERVDGGGYPDRLADGFIPLLSRIIAVADAYNAMTSVRPYRDAMPSRVARLRLAQAVETQFDTGVVAAFEAILAGASEAYRLGSSAEFDLTAREIESDSDTKSVVHEAA